MRAWEWWGRCSEGKWSCKVRADSGLEGKGG